MATFFEKNKKNFQDVEIVEGKVNTVEFLDASTDLVGLFGECDLLLWECRCTTGSLV